MTSNLGSDLIRERTASMTSGNREEVIENTRRDVLEMLKRNIRPEFLNRIDDIIVFTPLTESEIADIVRLQFDAVVRLVAANDVQLQYTDSALALVARLGYDPQFGARPVKRVLQRYVLNELSKALLGGSVDTTRPIVIDTDADGETLQFRN